MKIPVAVADPVPSYRCGVVAALLQAGFDAEAIENPESWVKVTGRRALLVTATLPQEASRLGALTAEGDDVVIVVLLRDVSPAAYREALKQRAWGAVAWDAPPETMVEVLRAALECQCVLPTHVAQSLADGRDLTAELPELSDWETLALQLLANGATVADVANETKYSERETCWLLHRLYKRIGAGNRIEALVQAARFGLLELIPDDTLLPGDPAGA